MDFESACKTLFILIDQINYVLKIVFNPFR
jgi:hypothetical protein